MNIFELLSANERVIVLSNAENSQVYTWNQSLTLQCWDVTARGFQEVEARVLMETPESFEEAKKCAEEWLYSNNSSQAW